MDWKDSLQQFLDANPDIPAGNDITSADKSEKPVAKPRLDIILDRKGRKGKTATIISGFDPEDNDTLRHVATALKTALGTGGSARGGEILIQGDHRDDVASRLREMGYKTRLI